MRLYRRGTLYLACDDAFDAGFVYDSEADAARNVLPRLFLGDGARYWLPVLESDPVPQGLYDRLVLKRPEA